MRISAALILICGIVASCAHGFGGSERITVVGTVVARVDQLVRVSVMDDRTCEDRLLLRLIERRGAFQPGDYLVLHYKTIVAPQGEKLALQYDEAPRACELPREMFNGRSVWKFELSRHAVGQGPLRKLLPVWEFPGTDAQRTVDTSAGRIMIVRFANLTVLDGGRIEDLPLDSIVREFRLAPRSFRRVR